VTATFVAGGAISANVFAGTGTVHDAAFANQNGPAEYISCPSGCFSNVPPGQRWMHAHADDVGFVPSWDAPCIQPPTTVGQDSYCLIDVPVSQTSFVAVGFFDGSCGGSGCNPNP